MKLGICTCASCPSGILTRQLHSLLGADGASSLGSPGMQACCCLLPCLPPCSLPASSPPKCSLDSMEAIEREGWWPDRLKVEAPACT